MVFFFSHWVVALQYLFEQAQKNKDQTAVLLPEKMLIGQHKVFESCFVGLKWKAHLSFHLHGQSFKYSTSAGNSSSKCKLWTQNVQCISVCT